MLAIMLTMMSRHAERILLLLLVFAVLWRGGKSVDATWILTGVVALLVLLRKPSDADAEVPMLPWSAGFGFVLWTVVSFLASKTQNYGLDEVLRDGALFLVFTMVARTALADLSGRWRRFAMTLVLAAAFAAIIGAAVYALQPVNRFVGTFFDARFHTDYWPNAWAEFLLLCWPLALALALRSRIPWRRVAWVAALGLLLGGLLLSYSRGALLVFSGQVILLAAVWHFAPSGIPQTRSAGAFALAVLVALGVFAGVNRLRIAQYDVQSVGEKVTFTATEGTSSIDERSAFWRQSLVLLREHPVVGWGPYSFRFIQPRLAEGVLQTSDHPHNVFLKLLVERGMPTLLLYVMLLVSILVAAVRSLLRSSSAWALFGLIAVAGVFAHNLIDFNLQFVGIALPLWVVLGLLQAEAAHVKGRGRQRMMEVILASALLLLAVVDGFFLGISSLGRRAEAQGDAASALRWYGSAHFEIFRRDMDLSRATLLIKQNALDKGSDAIESYQKRNAEDPRIWQLRGRLLDLQQKPDQSLQVFQKAYSMGKWTNIGMLHSLLNAHVKTRRALTEEEFMEYYRVTKAYAAAIMQNAHFIALSTNVEELGHTVATLTALCPLSLGECSAKSEELDVMSVAATLHAGDERAKFRARPAGYLW